MTPEPGTGTPSWETWRFHQQFMDAVLEDMRYKLPSQGAAALDAQRYAGPQPQDEDEGDALRLMFEQAQNAMESHQVAAQDIEDVEYAAYRPIPEDQVGIMVGGQNIDIYTSAGSGNCVPASDQHCDLYKVSIFVQKSGIDGITISLNGEALCQKDDKVFVLPL